MASQEALHTHTFPHRPPQTLIPKRFPMYTAKLVQPATNARSFSRKTPCCQNMQPHHRCCQNTRLNSSNPNLIDCRARTPWQCMPSLAAIHTHTSPHRPPHKGIHGGTHPPPLAGLHRGEHPSAHLVTNRHERTLLSLSPRVGGGPHAKPRDHQCCQNTRSEPYTLDPIAT